MDSIVTITEAAATIGVSAVNVTNALAIVGQTHAVTITGAISAIDANFILNGTSGTVTAGILTDTASNLNMNLANATSSDALSFVVSADNVAAADLIDLNAKTNQIIDVTALTSAYTIEGNISELVDIYDTNLGQYNGLGNESVSIIGVESAANVNTIANATSGAVTAIVAPAAASVLAGALTNTTTTDALILTVNAEAAGAGATAAADLVALNADTNQAINMPAVISISGSLTDLNDIYVTNAIQYTGKGDESVVVTDTSISDVGDLNTIDIKTSGTVDITAATSITGTVAELLAVGDADDAGTILTYTDPTSGNEAYNAVLTDTANYAQFTAINADTEGKLDFYNVSSYLALGINEADDINLANLAEADGLTKIVLDNSEANVISGVSISSLKAVTGGETTLTIDGDSNDTISFTTNVWTQTTSGSDMHYTTTSFGTEYTVIDLNGGMTPVVG